jgi:hypothetical protein
MARKVARKRYLVAIPVPSLDREGEPLNENEIREWTRRVLDELTVCFGGATPIPAPGTNVVQGPSGDMVTLFEGGQVLVLSACDSRGAFIRKRKRIVAFAARMADALRQEAVFVLAFPSDSFLVEGAIRPNKKDRK